MGLTTILTTIWVCPPKYAQVQILIFKENWTCGDILGHAADVWGSMSHEFLYSPAATVMILPMTDDLAPRVKARKSGLMPTDGGQTTAVRPVCPKERVGKAVKAAHRSTGHR